MKFTARIYNDIYYVCLHNLVRAGEYVTKQMEITTRIHDDIYSVGLITSCGSSAAKTIQLNENEHEQRTLLHTCFVITSMSLLYISLPVFMK